MVKWNMEKAQKVNKIYQQARQHTENKAHPEKKSRFPLKYVALGLGAIAFFTYLKSIGF